MQLWLYPLLFLASLAEVPPAWGFWNEFGEMCDSAGDIQWNPFPSGLRYPVYQHGESKWYLWGHGGVIHWSAFPPGEAGFRRDTQLTGTVIKVATISGSDYYFVEPNGANQPSINFVGRDAIVPCNTETLRAYADLCGTWTMLDTIPSPAYCLPMRVNVGPLAGKESVCYDHVNGDHSILLDLKNDQIYFYDMGGAPERGVNAPINIVMARRSGEHFWRGFVHFEQTTALQYEDLRITASISGEFTDPVGRKIKGEDLSGVYVPRCLCGGYMVDINGVPNTIDCNGYIQSLKHSNATVTPNPTHMPTTSAPITAGPTRAPTVAPTTTAPTSEPTAIPTANPTSAPTLLTCLSVDLKGRMVGGTFVPGGNSRVYVPLNPEDFRFLALTKGIHYDMFVDARDPFDPHAATSKVGVACRSTMTRTFEDNTTFFEACEGDMDVVYRLDETLLVENGGAWNGVWTPLCTGNKSLAEAGTSDPQDAAAANDSETGENSMNTGQIIGLVIGILASVSGLVLTIYKLHNERKNQKAKEKILQMTSVSPPQPVSVQGASNSNTAACVDMSSIDAVEKLDNVEAGGVVEKSIQKIVLQLEDKTMS